MEKNETNVLDVAIELTKLFYESAGFKDVEEVQNTYLKFYAVANLSKICEVNLKKHMPKDSLE